VETRLDEQVARCRPLRAVLTAAAWKLEEGDDGKRTVWAQFADADGRQSAPVPDDIALDTKPPAVKKAKPAPGATGVRRGTKIKVKLSEPLERASVDSHAVVLKRSGASKKSKVAVKLTYRPGKHMLVAKPRSKLAAGTTYKVKVRATVVDLAGNPLKAKKKGGHEAHPLTWKFSTG
jgi:hypothetical protein